MNAQIKETITFDPRAVVISLLAELPDRARQIIIKRYGLKSKEGATLEAIGQVYGITRERVRQIEEFTLRAIKKSETFAKLEGEFAELKKVLESYGGVAHEREFLRFLSLDQMIQNHIHFMLVLGESFDRLREDEAFHHRWTVDHNLAEAVHASIKNLCQNLTVNDLLPENRLVEEFLKTCDKALSLPVDEAQARRWLTISKEIGQSPTGEWGLTSSPNVRVRGIRDYAYLVLRRGGEPMHFNEVAKQITAQFKRKANPATTHNELIKDDRFVLVGRGIYALTEWGYRPGITREIIEAVLKKQGPLSKDEIMEKVLKERQVKPNTVLVNLKNPKFFKQDKQGRFSVA
jgi:hypothetical protein